jgi:hypothetical protein
MSYEDLVRGLPRPGFVPRRRWRTSSGTVHFSATIFWRPGYDRDAVDVEDDVGHATVHHAPESFGQLRCEHAVGFEVIGVAFDHLLVVDLGQLGWSCLWAQSAARTRVARVSREPALDMGWPLRSVLPVSDPDPRIARA